MLTYVEIYEYFNIVLFSFAGFFAILLLVLFYHGVFYKVIVKTTKPPFVKDLFVVYKFTLKYSESRHLLTEVQTLAPHLDSFSIYHEAFYQTRSQVGSSVGVVLSDRIKEDLYRKLLNAGYKVAIFPAVDFAVVSSFPYRNHFSLAVAVNRIYPKLREYIKANRLCAHPIMELYTKDTVHFIAPLSKQFDFYADEAIAEYDESSSEVEEEEDVKTTCSKCQQHPGSKSKQCCCDPLLHSTSCDQRKRAV